MPGRADGAKRVCKGASDDSVDRVEKTADGGSGDAERLGAIGGVAGAQLAAATAVDLGQDFFEIAFRVHQSDLGVSGLSGGDGGALRVEPGGGEGFNDGDDASRRLGVMVAGVVVAEVAVEEESGSGHGSGVTSHGSRGGPGHLLRPGRIAEKIIPAPPTIKRQGNQIA